MSAKQAEAILFGVALGDALGFPVEFSSLAEIKETYGPGGILEPPSPALFSDDTQMTLALVNGLLDAGLDSTIDEQMQAISREFIAWKNSPLNNRAPGLTCMNAVARLESGLPWYEAGIVSSKGCGSAMRVSTIGYLFQNQPERLREVAHKSGLITHGHAAAVAASIAAAYAVKMALDGVAVAEFLPRIMEFVDGVSEEFDQALRRVAHVGAWGNEEQALEHIGRGWMGDEAVALALYCIIRYPDDYAACVRRAANTIGDSDSIASIAGGIMGARLGLDAIPADWVARCERADEIRQVAQRMDEAREAYERARA
ncbi:ADP-ribosylglycohydrolase family protein [Anaerolineae bacterium CFX9]|nr:ADP-ribosylglycohydrolase family protein [Anaerolineae bacterium CFX9]